WSSPGWSEALGLDQAWCVADFEQRPRDRFDQPGRAADECPGPQARPEARARQHGAVDAACFPAPARRPRPRERVRDLEAAAWRRQALEFAAIDDVAGCA